MTPTEKLRHHVTGAIERGEAEAVAGIPQSGTAWTEPGQGATMRALWEALLAEGGTFACGTAKTLTERYPGGYPAIPDEPTNLALIVENPLTADDVRRIGEAK